MKKKSYLPLLFSVLMWAGCASPRYVADYKIKLSAVEVSNGEAVDPARQIQNGRTDLGSFNDESVGKSWVDPWRLEFWKYKSSFSDGQISIYWCDPLDGFIFKLENKTQEPLSIILDEVVFVDQSGKSHLEGAGQDRQHVVPPVVPKGSVLERSLNFRNPREFMKGEWVLGFLPTTDHYDVSLDQFKSALQKYVGKIRVVLPIKIKETTVAYTFEFTVESASAHLEKH